MEKRTITSNRHVRRAILAEEKAEVQKVLKILGVKQDQYSLVRRDDLLTLNFPTEIDGQKVLLIVSAEKKSARELAEKTLFLICELRDSGLSGVAGFDPNLPNKQLEYRVTFQGERWHTDSKCLATKEEDFQDELEEFIQKPENKPRKFIPVPV